jgi:hypothetical protein
MSRSKGQVSIFLIFIFHILFLFFAMVINVGMMVHHKINLQNAVDLAAYYGAMKQAEILGAIAHSNYQIRQSWKLMNFRYNILGGLGREDHPAQPNNVNDSSLSQDVDSDRAAVFCMAIDDLFLTRGQESSQSLCKKSTPTMSIAGMKVPEFVGAIAYHKSVTEGIQKARDQADNDFKDGGVRNFRLLTLFVTLYRSDVKNRKAIINELASQLSHEDEDFKDLEGGSTYTGVQKTFFNNLTEDNKNSKIRFYNSMGNAKCGRRDDNKFPPVWLKQITALPEYIYYDAGMNTDPGQEGIRYSGGFTLLTSLPELIGTIAGLSADQIDLLETMQQLSHPDQRPDINFFDIVGVEKNPWCLTYAGVSAIAAPSLPFMPNSVKINLTATAYAKPFGGKVGPWYMSQWSRSSDKSDGGKKIDPLIPMRFEDTAALTSGKSKDYKERRPNYSRYPGDTVGIISQQTQWAYGKMIREVRLNKGFTTYDAASWITKTKDLMQSQNSLYSGLPFMPSNLDILAEDVDKGTNAFKGGAELREIETMAVAPDIFDITYYSIEPNFSSLYLIRRLKSLFPDFFPRGDMGATATSPFSVIDQMLVVGKNQLGLDISSKGIYHTVYTPSKDPKDPIWGRVLTNWGEKSLLDYNIDQVKAAGMFGHCKEPIPDDLQKTDATQGECLTGGRTGYSVKLVSRKFLDRTDLPLGGASTGGAILNPPPDNFEY